jgi:hypothetical protein
LTEVYDQIWSSEKRITKIPELLELLMDPDYVTIIINRIKKNLGNNLPMGIILEQICILLKANTEIEDILSEECEENFVHSDDYHDLMFTCSLFIYTEYFKIHGRK